MTYAEKRKVEEYKKESLPSDQGVVVQTLKGEGKSFIPKEAIRASETARAETDETESPTDPFNQDRVSHGQPVVDSSDETLGG